MSLRSVVTKELESKTEIVYPCLMKSLEDGLIILTDKDGLGLVIHDPVGGYAIGKYKESKLKYFEYFKGSITLNQS